MAALLPLLLSERLRRTTSLNSNVAGKTPGVKEDCRSTLCDVKAIDDAGKSLLARMFADGVCQEVGAHPLV